ncbi:lysylphosphatidylglycerol synthase transmembrane domain-containing protein [Bernardetia sp.]|uniref:lysylphosphatidylglycerol synthase transmembrane domain-containing protein n=1 Tax=Bernardetia sp. TaxID=1937974 RepID=UPI0025C3F560|nr:lysylphosphatidylglycerol synthase transmembrane domain-containing protein [Bernardetia sp.]
MNSTLKKTLQIGVSLFVGILLIYLLYRNTDTEKMLNTLLNADYRFVFLSMLLGCLAHWSRGVRWVIALRPLGYKIQKRRAFVAVMTGYLMNTAVPRAGEVARCMFLKRTDKLPIATSLGSVIGERALDFILLVSITTTTFFVEWEIIKGFLDKYADFGIYERAFYDNLWLIWVLIFVVAISLVFMYFYREQILKNNFVIKIRLFLAGIWQGVSSITKLNRKQQLFYIIHTLIIWACYHLMIYVLFFSIEETSNLTVMAGFTAMVMAGVGMVIPIPGGTGSFHVFVMYTLIAYGIEEQPAKTFAAFAHGAQTLMILVIGGVSMATGLYLWARNPNAKNTEEQKHSF